MSSSLVPLFLAAVVAIELVRRLPLLAAFRRMALTSRRVGRMLKRRSVSERWMELAMRKLSARLFGQSLGAAGLLAAVAAPIGLVLALDRPFNLGALEALGDASARAQLTLLCITYAVFRYFVARALRRR